MTPETKDKLRADAIFFSRPTPDGSEFDQRDIHEFASIVVEFMAWTEQKMKALMDES